MDTDADLPTLIRRKDHLNVLRYVRVFQLREPALVVEHGKAWLGVELNKTPGNSIIRRTALEQIALAALDLNESALASKCLDRLKQDEGVPAESVRFRRLLARCLEASGDLDGAESIYKALLADNETPANASAWKRQYCLHKAQVGHEIQAHETLVKYLTDHPQDAAGWYELAQLRKRLGDFRAAVFCYEEALLASSPLDATLHVELAECCATAAMAGVNSNNSSNNKGPSTLELLLAARQHMAQALELDPTHTRAQWGLLQCSNLYLQHTKPEGSSNKKGASAAADPFQAEVAKALMEHAAEALQQTYRKTPLEAVVKQLCKEYLEEEGDEI
ncbi:hypothetical protein ACA910_006651 [Epithemia clementina (nom. ined.)]